MENLVLTTDKEMYESVFRIKILKNTDGYGTYPSILSFIPDDVTASYRERIAKYVLYFTCLYRWGRDYTETRSAFSEDKRIDLFGMIGRGETKWFGKDYRDEVRQKFLDLQCPQHLVETLVGEIVSNHRVFTTSNGNGNSIERELEDLRECFMGELCRQKTERRKTFEDLQERAKKLFWHTKCYVRSDCMGLTSTWVGRRPWIAKKFRECVDSYRENTKELNSLVDDISEAGWDNEAAFRKQIIAIKELRKESYEKLKSIYSWREENGYTQFTKIIKKDQ